MSNALGDISNLSNVSNSSTGSITNNTSISGRGLFKRKSHLVDPTVTDENEAPIKPKNQLCFNLTSFIENINLDQEK
jgi:hypothetical protein